MQSSFIAMAVPVFFTMIAAEAWIAHRRKKELYRLSDSVNSLSCGMTQQAADVGLKLVGFGLYALVYEHFAITTLDATSPLVWIGGALAVDLLYYTWHRASHRVNALWAAHIVHHQSEEYNLTTALRQSMLTGMTAALFYWPLALLGLPPLVFVALSTLNTLYQFWIHTRLIGRMGPLELVLNTPSHHRVHHGIDPKYIDKNYGGILIVWDRLFGTFQVEEEEPAYGTVKPLRSWNPIWASLEHWAHMLDMARRTRRVADKLRVFVAPPEWRPADLGGPVTIPAVDHATRQKYDVAIPRALSIYVALQLGLTTLAVVRLITSYEATPMLETGLLIAWIAVSLVACGALLEQRRWAGPLELAARLATPGLALFASGPLAIAFVPWAALSIAAAAWLATRGRALAEAALPAPATVRSAPDPTPR